MRILVTGGAGFIGSHLCEHLVGEGHTVVAMDNLSGGRRESLASIAENPRFRLLERDVCDPGFIDEFAREEVFERVYHLACPASPLQYLMDPLRTLNTCVLGTTHVLDLARRAGARFLLASTSEVYGDPLVHPQPESYWGNVNPIGPRACYDEGKRCAETFSMEYAAHRGVSVRIARIFNTYGPRMTDGDGRVVTTFIHQALRNEDITVFGDGSQTRSFCYVDDLRDGLVRLMEHPESPGPVNLGNPEEVTVLALARVIIDAVGATSAIVMRDLPTDDPKRRRPDIALARRILDFAPRVSLHEGLERTIAATRRGLELAS